MKSNLLVIIFIALAAIVSNAQQLAFPGAEGYGKYTTGGRGGAVYEVTTLNPTGTGSLGAAITASGPRTVVFRVSGTITGNFSINNGDITIAGQTAPGDGICIKGNLSINANNVIIRYIRVRWNPAMGENDAISGRFHKNIIMDHVSASWSTDEVFSIYMNENVTIQWCMITEAAAKFVDNTNTGHRFGGIWGNNNCTMHHNLIAHNDSRNPRWASGVGFNDYRNNVLYNWGYQGSYGGEKTQTSTDFGFTTINIIGNYYKPGPATAAGVMRRIVQPSARSEDDKGEWYVSGNFVEGFPDVTADNWKGVDGSSYIKLNAPWDAMPINQQSPQEAYLSVLESAGSSRPRRDAVDERIINEVRTGTAAYGNNGMITGDEIQGWPLLNRTTAPVDSDKDGMPDSWETANGLNPNNASDRNTIGPGGFTMLEIYMNSLAEGQGCSTEQVSGVTVSTNNIMLGIGSSREITATIAPTCARNTKVNWSSSNPSVAKVSAAGEVTGLAAGTAIITATTAEGAFTAQTTVSVGTLANAINAGGPAWENFQADQFFTGGTVYSKSATMDLSQITYNTPPAEVFHTERYGAFSYTIPNLTPGSDQTVTLYFSENYHGAAGLRVFDVAINGQTVLSNFDIFVAAGGKNKALAKTFTTTATGNGQVEIQFTKIIENPKVSGIAILSAPVQPVTGISVSQATATVNVGATTQLTATVLPAEASNKDVTWSSSNTAIATVNVAGLVTGVAAGFATITATTTDGSFKATTVITVQQVIASAGKESDESKISVYPVPFSDNLNIAFKEPAQNVEIVVMDATGRIVRQLQAVNRNTQLNMTGLSGGLYFVRILGPTVHVVKPVIKK